ncbi:MAG: lipid-A-disaccharide synthase [Candidatus Thiodiazotropha sp. (ex Semelilucina semeliformis)]|nr:lipid-A-disaccharide synthase [Candidatus Thiodiazotropha sp. (ex Semelilucina semeliformis)]
MNSEDNPIRIGILANEVSGEQLAAALIEALQNRHPQIQFEGMTGPLMDAAGCRSLAKMDPVMGLTEILKHLPHLLTTRRRLADHFERERPDLVIGVDAPDFMLALERRLKSAGITTAHFVCPSVWAWRQDRAKKFRHTVDLMLCIFDFEVDFLRGYQVNAAYVGHPLADQIPLQAPDAAAVRVSLSLDPQRPVVALLPGSRMSEVGRLADDFLKTAGWCHQQRPELQFVSPMVNERVKQAFLARMQALVPDLDITLLDGQSREAIGAADLVLTASGTATLETLLLKRPMVVGYRLSPLSHWLIRTFNLLKIPHVAIANLLADQPLAPEFLQDACRPEMLGPALLDLLDDTEKRREIAAHYQEIHQRLRCNAADKAADVVLALIRKTQ